MSDPTRKVNESVAELATRLASLDWLQRGEYKYWACPLSGGGGDATRRALPSSRRSRQPVESDYENRRMLIEQRPVNRAAGWRHS
jgi:hypothetical protein